ncbi:FAD/NADP-binding domain-containing protein [Dacryopinax primogenitus]|uniref:Kynurenine 3-monooxygenase n=1 Tax=Dacryopinax primogenitus (strain DJM 731) TaxID=1858805 RepID=M5GAM9_DACPD|nr:FAD/NADP-binding domain-containing protein [Dacryopinax primogenitus]EJU05420.1 FAD/NADP-binding domain-containing protein [Dacryopinax primogenitus]
MSASSNARKVLIVGAGPVGCLTALSFAKMGWKVDLRESRPDIRYVDPSTIAHRSVNLAISSRAITALGTIDSGITARLLEDSIPMKGRMIHTKDGKEESQLYDQHGQHLNSMGRGLLNKVLLDELEHYTGVSVRFEDKLIAIDFERKTAIFIPPSADTLEVAFDFCIGADGAHSLVRRQMMRVVRMNFQQEYIPHDYVELHMSPGVGENGQPVFRIDPNHLHIWPRSAFMLIALPNKDKSFTCTLYAPTAELDKLETREQASDWFDLHFPDAVQLIGRESLLDDFEENPRSSLISVKTYPYHFKDCAVVIGDAAHAMVPFYGQGLNCGFEDVRVLTTLFKSFGVAPVPPKADEEDRLGPSLEEYSQIRREDLIAISDLAMYNYMEMRHHVITPIYRFRRVVDRLLSTFAPFVSGASLTDVLSRVPFPTNAARGWLPLYTMVTFRPDINYATAKRRAQLQTRILDYCGWLAGATAFSLSALGAWRFAVWNGVLRR